MTNDGRKRRYEKPQIETESFALDRAFLQYQTCCDYDEPVFGGCTSYTNCQAYEQLEIQTPCYS